MQKNQPAFVQPFRYRTPTCDRRRQTGPPLALRRAGQNEFDVASWKRRRRAAVCCWRQVVDLRTGSRRADVTASVGELRVSKSGRFVVAVDYARQHAVAVHCLDGLLRQLASDDVTSGSTRLLK